MTWYDNIETKLFILRVIWQNDARSPHKRCTGSRWEANAPDGRPSRPVCRADVLVNNTIRYTLFVCRFLHRKIVVSYTTYAYWILTRPTHGHRHLSNGFQTYTIIGWKLSPFYFHTIWAGYTLTVYRGSIVLAREFFRNRSRVCQISRYTPSLYVSKHLVFKRSPPPPPTWWPRSHCTHINTTIVEKHQNTKSRICTQCTERL